MFAPGGAVDTLLADGGKDCGGSLGGLRCVVGGFTEELGQ